MTHYELDTRLVKQRQEELLQLAECARLAREARSDTLHLGRRLTGLAARIRNVAQLRHREA